ncbi:MAG TPA: ATP-binding cassette domain-containing protein [candidate division WOR-3 bacterium]|uniref:ATP-binding cassette domain-containing protein n=1 Tax=candidate division WOR-3 bacterium TaxID=2052148 RepID=A0A7V0XF42_UNCW3|nr:ATP-binding cassette domain-containing protein [candidate division WOR-3 bacterium]
MVRELDPAPPRADPTPAVEVENVSRLYGGNWPALTDISFRVERGDFVFILGATGAGKTTLLRMLYGADRPDTGSVRVLGWDVPTLAAGHLPELRKRIGIVFQDFKLLADRTVAGNLEFVLRAINTRPDLIPGRVNETLTRLGIIHRRDAWPEELSGGEQQKVSIARAFVKEPELILADEPTGNIDPRGSTDILNILKDYNYRGTTVVMATHNSDLALSSRRRCVTLDAGRVVRDEG